MNGDGDSTQLFATLTDESGVLTARFVDANVGEREGQVVHKMIDARLAEMAETPRFVVLDFSGVTFINSAGLGACVMIRKSAAARDAPVVLYGQGPEIEAVFKMSGLNKIFKIAANEKKLAKIVS